MGIGKGDVIGPFKIERHLTNDGGTSRVYLAYDADRPDHRVAIKIADTDTENRHAFEELLRRETVYLNRLRHPGIVRIFPQRIRRHVVYAARADSHVDRPYYYAMEYLSAGSLENHVTEIVQKFSLDWSIELFYQLVTSIHYMHERGLAHCDLKPQNILFRQPPHPKQLPIPVLVDFGSAAPVKGMERLTASLRYSPPEVLMAMERKDEQLQRSIRPDKVDIWSLGVVFFEIITGRPLFDQKKRESITTTVLRGSLQTIKEIRRDAPEQLDKFMAKLLERQPEDRPTTGQIIEALEERMSSVRPPRLAS